MWSDRESESDYLNFGEVSQLAVDILTSPSMLPVSLGVFGNWGAGKSSLLKLIDADLQKSGQDHLVVNFDAWMYQGYDDARAALLEVIARELLEDVKGNDGLVAKTKGLLARVDKVRALGLLAEGTAMVFGMPTGGMLSRGVSAISDTADGIDSSEEYQAATKSARELADSAQNLVGEEGANTPPQQIDAFRREYGEILSGLGKPLIVTIDNLDRCLPANAIHTLEAIRLFLFLPNTAFVIAADEEMVRSAVSEHFKGASERHQIDYLDKLIQVPIRVPKAGVREIRSYLFMLYAIDSGLKSVQLEKLRDGLEVSLQQSWHADPITKEDALKLTGVSNTSPLATSYDLADRIAPILASSPIIHGNPRIVKRLLNVVKMRSRIAKRRGIPLDESVITKLVIFERCAGAEATADLYKMIDSEVGTPNIFRELESESSDGIPGIAPESWTKNRSTAEFIVNWSRLSPPLKDKDLRSVVYLSRETMPIGAYITGISPQGKELLKALVSVSAVSSPSGSKAAKEVSVAEQVPVMEGIVDQLRQVVDWTKQPTGFAGAVLLATESPDAARVLVRFIQDLGKARPWMSRMMKDQSWFEGA